MAENAWLRQKAAALRLNTCALIRARGLSLMQGYQCNLTWHEQVLCACALWDEEEAQAALSRLMDGRNPEGCARSAAKPASPANGSRNFSAETPTAQDWRDAARYSVQQGISPLVTRRLRAFMAHRAGTPPIVPPEVIACLERMLAANAHRNQIMLHHCARLLYAFHAEGIPCMALKGAALALAVYPDPALRNFADIDLLVPQKDYRRAGQIAVDVGFQSAFAEQDAALLHQVYHLFCEEDILTATLPLEFDTKLPADRIAQSRHRIVLEIHQGLFRDAAGFARDVDEAPLWERPQTASFPDGSVCALPSAEVMLVHLTTHAATHGFSRLQFPADIAGVIDRYAATLDWEQVTMLARHYEVVSNVARGLELAQRVSGACVPESVLQRLTASVPLRSWPQNVPLATLFAPANSDTRDVMLNSLMLSATPEQFLRGLKNMLFPPPLLMRRFYGARHPALIALLYAYRPLQLSGHLAGLLFRRLRPKENFFGKAR